MSANPSVMEAATDAQAWLKRDFSAGLVIGTFGCLSMFYSSLVHMPEDLPSGNAQTALAREVGQDKAENARGVLVAEIEALLEGGHQHG